MDLGLLVLALVLLARPGAGTPMPSGPGQTLGLEVDDLTGGAIAGAPTGVAGVNHVHPLNDYVANRYSAEDYAATLGSIPSTRTYLTSRDAAGNLRPTAMSIEEYEALVVETYHGPGPNHHSPTFDNYRDYSHRIGVEPSRYDYAALGDASVRHHPQDLAGILGPLAGLLSFIPVVGPVLTAGAEVAIQATRPGAPTRGPVNVWTGAPPDRTHPALAAAASPVVAPPPAPGRMIPHPLPGVAQMQQRYQEFLASRYPARSK